MRCVQLLSNVMKDLQVHAQAHRWYMELSLEGSEFVFFPWVGEQPRNMLQSNRKDPTSMHWWCWPMYRADEIILDEKCKEIVLKHPVKFNCFLGGVEHGSRNKKNQSEGIIGWSHLSAKFNDLAKILEDQHPELKGNITACVQKEQELQLAAAHFQICLMFSLMSVVSPQYIGMMTKSDSSSPASSRIRSAMSPSYIHRKSLSPLARNNEEDRSCSPITPTIPKIPRASKIEMKKNTANTSCFSDRPSEKSQCGHLETKERAKINKTNSVSSVKMSIISHNSPALIQNHRISTPEAFTRSGHTANATATMTTPPSSNHMVKLQKKAHLAFLARDGGSHKVHNAMPVQIPELPLSTMNFGELRSFPIYQTGVVASSSIISRTRDQQAHHSPITISSPPGSQSPNFYACVGSEMISSQTHDSTISTSSLSMIDGKNDCTQRAKDIATPQKKKNPGVIFAQTTHSGKKSK